MSNTMDYMPLDMEKIRSKKQVFVSSEDALKDVIPIEWSDDVLSGTRKVMVTLPDEVKVCAE